MSQTPTQEANKFFTKKNTLIAIGSFCLLVLIIGLFAGYVLDIDFTQLKNVANQPLTGREGYLVGLVLMCIYQWFWYCTNIVIAAKPYGLKAKFHDILIMGLVCTLMVAISPFSLLSEPYKVYWLSRRGLSAREALLTVSSTVIFWTLTQIVITWPSFIILSTKYAGPTGIASTTQGLTAYWFSFVGMMTDISIVVLLFATSFSSRFHVAISVLIARIRKRFKRPYKTKEQIVAQFRAEAWFKNEYIKRMKDWKHVVPQAIGWALISLTGYFAVDFAIRLMQVKPYQDLPFTDVFNVANVAISGNNFLPIPGSEGTMQLFIRYFIDAINGTKDLSAENNKALDTAIFVWRAFYFYLLVFMGLLCLPYEIWQSIRFEKRIAEAKRNAVPIPKIVVLENYEVMIPK